MQCKEWTKCWENYRILFGFNKSTTYTYTYTYAYNYNCRNTLQESSASSNTISEQSFISVTTWNSTKPMYVKLNWNFAGGNEKTGTSGGKYSTKYLSLEFNSKIFDMIRVNINNRAIHPLNECYWISTL